MIVYRLVHDLALQTAQPFRPRATNNRWNTDAVTVAYASESLALAAMEMLTYWGRYASLRGYRIYTYELDAGDVEDLLPADPDLDLGDRTATQAYGDAWAAEGRSLALRVPSVVLPASSNHLINPEHPDFDPGRSAGLGPFSFDPRIDALVDAAKGGRSG